MPATSSASRRCWPRTPGDKATSDANGYYEVPMPYGVGRVWCAGVGVTYNGIPMALSLPPADGEMDDFVSKTGGVENFVLLTHGIAIPSGVNDNPAYSGNYYGGTSSVGYSTREVKDTFSPQHWLTFGSEVGSGSVLYFPAAGNRGKHGIRTVTEIVGILSLFQNSLSRSGA
jgi:hypothetical protein